MDLSQFLGTSFLKIADLKDGPIKVRIVEVQVGQYSRPDLTFDDGSKLSCNVTNARVLARHYGVTSEDWLDKEVELRVGEIDFKGAPQEAILVKPISPPVTNKPPKPKKGSGGFDDDIPY